jgi:receptor expression-enhancing protein 5/6
MADQIQQYISKFDKELSRFPPLVKLEKETKIPKVYAVGGVLLFVVILIFFNIAGGLLTNLLGFLYPAYASFKAIESSRKEDDVQWWVIFLEILDWRAPQS